MIASSVMVIAARNPVHSVLFLILAFFNAAGLFVMQGAEFLAMLLIIIYVGAVAILFLFVVMMLNIDFKQFKEGFLKYLPFGIAVAVILLTELIMAINFALNNEVLISAARNNVAYPIDPEVTNTHAIGLVLYTDFAMQFIISGLILLVSMVGAVTLTLRQRDDVRKQKIYKQISRTKEESVKIVKLLSGKGI